MLAKQLSMTLDRDQARLCYAGAMDRPSDAPRLMAPGASSGAVAYRLPEVVAWPPVDE